MKGRLFSLFALLAVASILLAACSAGQPTAPAASNAGESTPAADSASQAPASGDTTGGVTLTVFVGFGTGTDPSQIDLHNQLAEQYHQLHPDVTVQFITVNYDDHDSKFTSMIAGGLAPDLVMPIGVMGIAGYQDEWLDISPYIQRDNYDLSDFYGPAVAMHTYTDKVVGLPLGVYPSVLFYDADMFDKAGLDYPPHTWGQADWTYDKLAAVAAKLTLDSAGNSADDPAFNPDDIVQWGWDGWDWSPWRIIPAKFGGNTLGVSADMKTAEMTTPEWQAGMQFLADSIWKTHIHPTYAVTNSAFSEVDPIGSNTVAMWEVFSWIAYAYGGWTETFNWDVAAIPAGPNGTPIAQANGDTFAIPKDAAHPDEAWEFAKWLWEPAQMKQLTESYGCIPARKSLADGWLAARQEENPNVDWQVFIDAINYMDSSPNNEGWVPNYRKVWDAMENAMQIVTSGQNTDVTQVLSDLNGEVQGYLDEYWAQQ